MTHLSLYIHLDSQKSGNWTLFEKLDFASMDSRWMLSGKIPEEHEIVPWQSVTLPGGEKISLGLVFDDPAQSLGLYVKSEAGPILDLFTKGNPYLRFVSPAGVDVSLQVHEGDET